MELRVMSAEEARRLPGKKLIISPSSIYQALGTKTGRLPSQAEYARLSKQNKFILNIGGFRSGKTVEACVQGLLASLTHPGSFGAILRQVEASIEDSIMRTWFSICPAEVIASFNVSKKHLHLINGSQVIFRGFDRVEYLSKLRSVSLDWFIVCQAEEISLDNFRLLQSRLSGAHGPLKGWLEANPPPESHWLWQEFVDHPKPGYAYVQSSTIENKENLPPDYVDDLLSVGDEEWIKRYVYGERIAFRGLVFPNFSRKKHVRPPNSLPKTETHLLLKDWGWSNPGVSLVVGITHDGQWVVIREVYRRELPLYSPSFEEDWISIDLRLVQEFGITEGYADPSRPDAIALYNERGIPMEPGGNDRRQGIECIRSQLDKETMDGPGLLVSEACPNLIAEFESYKFKMKAGEYTEMPEDRDDHGLDALKAGLLRKAAGETAEAWISDWEEAPERNTLRELVGYV